MRTSFSILLVSVLAAVFAQAAAAYDATEMYDPSEVVFVDLTLSDQAITDLEGEPEEYVPGTFSLTRSSNGTPTGEEGSPVLPTRPVEVRLKGSVGGSFREITEKAGFKLKFKKADAFLGLRKMTLNNMVQDPSMVHETLAYAAFRASGVPASRTGFAYVRLNGEDIGVYLNLENLDDIGLTRIFGSTFDQDTQHLYEGERGDDLVPGGAGNFEVDEGGEEPDEFGDLEALIEAVNDDDGAPLFERVVPHAELAEMGRMWGVEKYIEHWDGYAGHTDQTQAGNGERPNNYYLYSDPTGRFQMLPWGTDQTWQPTDAIPGRKVAFDGAGGVFFNKCLEDKECFRAYWAGLNLATHTIPDLDPAALAEDTADLLAPWQQEERDSGRPEPDADEAEEIEDGVEETLDFIAGRQAQAQAWLDENEPPPIVNPVLPGQKDAPPSSKSGPALLFAHSGRTGRWVTARLQLSGPGSVGLRATIGTRKGIKRACASSTQAGAAGEAHGRLQALLGRAEQARQRCAAPRADLHACPRRRTHRNTRAQHPAAAKPRHRLLTDEGGKRDADLGRANRSEAECPGPTQLLPEGVANATCLQRLDVALCPFVAARTLKGGVETKESVVHRPNRHPIWHRPGPCRQVVHRYEVGLLPLRLE